MMCIKKIYPIILACLIAVPLVTADDPGSGMSKNIFNFLSMFNGVFSTSDPDKLVQCRCIPMSLPALGPNPFLFTEDAFKGYTHIIQLLEVTERNGTIFLTPFNVTNAKYKFEEFNPDSLSTFTREDLHTDPACEVEFVPDDDGIFVGDWPDCKDFVTGQRPTYDMAVTCDAITASMPVGAEETKARKPYKLYFSGKRFPVNGAPDNYDSPCEKQ